MGIWRQHHDVWCGRVPCRSGAAAGTAGAAFTLIELILAIVLILFLGMMIATSYSGLKARQDLDESSDKFQTAIRLAQAEAASSGKRLRFEFDSSAGTCKVLIEPLPLTQPNVFEEYAACSWKQYLPGELCSVAASTFTGSSAFQTVTFGQQSVSQSGSTADQSTGGQSTDQQAAAMVPITFMPDGSCDSATVELVSRSPQDQRKAVIEIDGLNGGISGKIMTQAEYEEYKQQEAGQ